MRSRDRPYRDAIGRYGEHSRSHHVPNEPTRRRFDDGRTIRTTARTIDGTKSAGHPTRLIPTLSDQNGGTNLWVPPFLHRTHKTDQFRYLFEL